MREYGLKPDEYPGCPKCSYGRWDRYPKLKMTGRTNPAWECWKCGGLFDKDLKQKKEAPKGDGDPSNPGNLIDRSKVSRGFGGVKWSKPSLHHCLVELGAPAVDVMAYETRHRYNIDGDSKKKPSISDLQDGELLAWAEYLYREKLKECHPDRHNGSKIYTEYCQYLSEMIQRIRKIISGR